MSPPTTRGLREALRKGPLLVAPGAYDALSARLIERAGFPAVYMSGAGASYSLLGAPDLGLLSFEEMVGQVRRIAQAVHIPVVADADTGFGNALNVIRTVREYEAAGADAVQLEDQSMPKRCGHLTEKRLIPAEEMAGKIRAACDARSSPDILIIARTDAVGPEGLESALQRLERYERAGADLLFLEAPPNAEAYQEARARLKAPLMANMVEGGRTPLLRREELEALGVRLVIFPGAAARAAAFAVQDLLRTLREEGTTRGYLDRMLLFDQLNEVVGLPGALEQGQKYSSDEHSP